MSESPNRKLQDQFMLRLPDGMRDRIRAAAEANARSMNSEIIATLEEKYPAPRSIDPALVELFRKLVLKENITEAADPRIGLALEETFKEWFKQYVTGTVTLQPVGSGKDEGIDYVYEDPETGKKRGVELKSGGRSRIVDLD